MPISNPTIADTLNLAADLIQEYGWAHIDTLLSDPWGYDGPTTPLCIEGGIAAALCWPPDGFNIGPRQGFADCPAYRAVIDYLDWYEGSEAKPLFEYNDADGRTAEEVVAVLRGAALVEAARKQDGQVPA